MPPSTMTSVPTMKADSETVAVPREPNTLYIGWRAGDGRALAWWLEKLSEPRLCARLVDGVDSYA